MALRRSPRNRNTPAPGEAPVQPTASVQGEKPTKSSPKKPSPLRNELKRSASEPPAEHPEPQAKKRRSMEATAEVPIAKDGNKSTRADAAADSDSSLLQAMAVPKPLNHCGSCKSWCTCPKGVTYPNPSPEHLSVSALEKAQEGMPVSAMRSTAQTPFPGESIYPNALVQKQCTDGVLLLCKIPAPAQQGTISRVRCQRLRRLSRRWSSGSKTAATKSSGMPSTGRSTAVLTYYLISRVSCPRIDLWDGNGGSTCNYPGPDLALYLSKLCRCKLAGWHLV
ncbi:hypothetical protein KC333_g160 [Hortaea werneckii]|nr:hypothetical protein KC333_g160 [Hortaea werneckii]